MPKPSEILKNYEEKVVDLSRRNRLLKYPKRGRTIDFKMSFSEFQEEYGPLDEFSIQLVHKDVLKDDEDDGDDEVSDQDKEPLILPTGEKLLDVLRVLRLDTKRKFDEHGLHTLFLTIGKVSWKEPQAGTGSSSVMTEMDYSAPMLIVPVKIDEKKNPKKTTIEPYGEIETGLNQVLALFLEKEHGARRLGLNAESLGDLGSLMEKISLQYKEIFAELNIKIEIKEEIQIGQYSFYGQQIYEDLSHNEEALIGHEFIGALCAKAPILQDASIAQTEFPEGILTPEEDFNILEADESQLAVIQQVLAGQHLNVQGPPGTGKSQTIVNLIANLLAREKSILFVCEKQVALEVVLKRLHEKGLDKACLPLFQHNADKRTFAKQIIQDRDYILHLDRTSSDLSVALNKRETAIKKLRAYAIALGKVVEPLGKSLYWVHGELIRQQTILSAPAVVWGGKDPLTISLDEYQAAMATLGNISPVFHIQSDQSHAHWRGVLRQHFSPDFLSRVNGVLEEIYSILGSTTLTKFTRIKADTIEELRRIISAADDVNAVEDIGDKFVSSYGLAGAASVLTEVLVEARGLKDYLDTRNKKYRIPTAWPNGATQALKGRILDSASIGNLRDAQSSFSTIDENVRLIKKANKAERDFISESVFEDLDRQEKIIRVDPILKLLKDWRQITGLRSAETQLQNLIQISERIDGARAILDKWAVAPEAIGSDAVTSVKNFERFDNPVLRYLFRYGEYKKTRGILSALCGVTQPKKYAETREVALTVRQYYHATGHFTRLFEKFRQELTIESGPVDAAVLPILHANVRVCTEWLTGNKATELPERVASFLERKIASDAFPKALEAAKRIAAIRQSLTNIIDEGALRLHDSPQALHTFVTTVLSPEVEAALSIHNVVCPLVAEGQLPETTGDLRNDATQIDEVWERVKKVEATDVQSVYKDFEITDCIERFDLFEAESTNVIRLHKAVTLATSKASPKTTIGNGMVSVYDLQEKLPELVSWMNEYDSLIGRIESLFENPEGIRHFEKVALSNYRDAVAVMKSDQAGLEKWTQFRRYAHEINELGQEWFIEKCAGSDVLEVESAFAVSFWNAWLEAHYRTNVVLRGFDVHEHTKLIEQFRKFELEVMEINSSRILQKLAPSIREAKRFSGDCDQNLLHQSQLKKRHKPIRKVVNECGAELLKFKPCWMMSPLTLSSYIPYGTVEFDVVIFDEASQMRVEHALGSIARAKQIVVFGDEHQLPPTSFFEIADDADEEVEDSFESILQASKSILPDADKMLKLHYRSKYEELVAFSNHHIYDDSLITFPNPSAASSPVKFVHVKDGVFDGGVTEDGPDGKKITPRRHNMVEAMRVAELCIKHAQENAEKSLGVIAFSKSQEKAIRTVLEDRLKNYPECQAGLDENSDAIDAFFIKNLESVQGDERDVIILSVGYGPDKTGAVYNRFGPLNSANGYRRLNVAVTRAKEQVICVSSMLSTQMNPKESARGAVLLQKYLEFAEKGITALKANLLVRGEETEEADSPFEEDVQDALEKRGFSVRRQIGVSGFKIDLAVINPENDAEYALGIECDGASYHSSYFARTNDRIRQQILEKLGWKIYRIWSQHWITHKEDIVDDIVRRVSSRK